MCTFKKLGRIMPVFAVLVAGATAALVTPELLAQEQISDLARRGEENVTALKSFAIQLFFFIGVVLAGLGLFLFYKDGKQPNQGHAKNGFVAIIIGGCLLSYMLVTGVVGSTIFGSGTEAQSNISTSSGF